MIAFCQGEVQGQSWLLHEWSLTQVVRELSQFDGDNFIFSARWHRNGSASTFQTSLRNSQMIV